MEKAQNDFIPHLIEQSYSCELPCPGKWVLQVLHSLNVRCSDDRDILALVREQDFLSVPSTYYSMQVHFSYFDFLLLLIHLKA
jgi:hypothetical protein